MSYKRTSKQKKWYSTTVNSTRYSNRPYSVATCRLFHVVTYNSLLKKHTQITNANYMRVSLFCTYTVTRKVVKIISAISLSTVRSDQSFLQINYTLTYKNRYHKPPQPHYVITFGTLSTIWLRQISFV